MHISNYKIAKFIDHTLLIPNIVLEDIRKICLDAMEYNFAGVCVNPIWIKEVSRMLSNSNVLPITVIGFPLGATTTNVKVFETQEAIQAGAMEIDMVINISALIENNLEIVKNDIYKVVQAAAGKPVKAIIETSLLSNRQKIIACKLAQEAGASFIKTSTGFSVSGAKIEDIKLIRHTIGDLMGIKASGGIRTRKDAANMLEAGANRIGSSASVFICETNE